MKCEALILLAACLALSVADPESDDHPLDFLIERCGEPEDSNGCILDLLRTALDRTRPKFSTGVEVGNKTVVLEPLKLPQKSREGRSSGKLQVKEAEVQGLSQLELDSVILTDKVLAARVHFPELAGEVRGVIKYGFLPIRLTLKVKLLAPRLMVGARWNASSGELQLEQPEAQLWLEGYNVTLSGMGSTGRSLADKLNENHQEIFEFLKPSLEAAVERRIERLDQEERNAGLSWLEYALS